MNIPLGYEIDTGKRVAVPLNHMVVLGQTQLSGKTTTLEALVARSGLRAVAFITKPGEKSFRLMNPIPAYFSESTTGEYWEYVISIIENKMQVHLGWQERGWITKLCLDYDRAKTKTKAGYKWKKPKSLGDLLRNVEAALPQLTGTQEMICIQLREYLRPAVKEIEKTEFSSELKLSRGINVMDLTELSDGLKTLVIRSVIDWIHTKMRKTIVIVPEAWKFIPEGRTTPVKLALEGLIREGAGVENFVWLDSQDLRGVDKKLLRSVIVWLFGVQRQRNEVASTLDSIPDHPKPTATEIMQLGKGQFFVCYGTTLTRTYVQPAGMEEEHAKAIAVGEERPESWKGIIAALGEQQREETEPGDGSMAERDVPVLDGNRRNSQGRDSGEDFQEKADAGERSPDGVCEQEDEAMWKEKYEATLALHESLKRDYEKLVEEYETLAHRLAKLEDSATEPLTSSRNVEQSGGAEAPDAPAPPAVSADPKSLCLEKALSNGHMDTIYNYIVARAAAEKQPALLRVLSERHELQIAVQRQVLETNAGNLRGALGILISEKFFDGAREFADARKELIRRGFLASKAPNLQISQALQGLVELGFLTKEETGYQAVAGMKINIMERK